MPFKKGQNPRTKQKAVPHFERYGVYWPQGTTDIEIHMQCVRQGGSWFGWQKKKCGLGLFEHFKQLKSLLWPNIVWHKWNLLELECFLKYRIVGEIGPASCVLGSTRIDNPFGESKTIAELCSAGEAPAVKTLYGPAQARVPFVKGIAPLFEVTLSNGHRFCATGEHLVLAKDGDFCRVENLRAGSVLLGDVPAQPQTISAHAWPTPPRGAPHCQKKVEGLQFGYPAYPDCDDAQLLLAEAFAQGAFPSRADARECKGYACGDLSARVDKPEHSRLCQCGAPPSIPDDRPQVWSMETSESPLSSAETALLAYGLSRHVDLSLLRICPQRSFLELTPGDFCKHPIAPPCLELTFQKYTVHPVAVASIKPIGQHLFYDLQVPDFHHYFAEGAIHHNSGKSHSAATNFLLDYWCWPECTTVIVSSTTRESLEMRIWGEMKAYFRDARNRVPWLPGNLIEGRQRIVTDERSESIEGRDFRNGICFPSGSMVDTPNGPKPIERIKVGDWVINAAGTGRVLGTHESIAAKLVRVRLADGRAIDCTKDHPFLTHRGWIKAVELETSDKVFSGDETLRILQQPASPRISQSQILRCKVPRLASRKTLRDMRKTFSPVESKTPMDRKNQGAVLLQGLRGQMGNRPQTGKVKKWDVRSLRQVYEEGALQSQFLLDSMPSQIAVRKLSALRKGIHVQSEPSQAVPFLQSLLQDELEWETWSDHGHVRDTARTCRPESLPSSHVTVPSAQSAQEQGSPFLSLGCRISASEAGRGNRRGNALHEQETGLGSHYGPGGSRVAGVEILERRSDPRFVKGRSGYPVYNLEVAGHPSYSISGVIVHNCGTALRKGQTWQGLAELVGVKNKRVRLLADELQFCPKDFISAISNLNKNADFKCGGYGNPKDPQDALGMLCEPAAELGGWEGGIDQQPGTKTWQIRFDQGICIQLPGSDSPNLDGKLGIPLISQANIDSDIAFWGRNSIQFTMMNEGRMPRGLGARRVLTRTLCTKFRALEEVVWKDGNQVKLGFMDAAYRGIGGDRCIFGEMKYGLDVEERNILAMTEYMVVPIVDDTKIDPEDQIAEFVKAQCLMRGIAPNQFGFDSTGRGTLMSAFARIWDPYVQAIEFGGSASERVVKVEPNGKKITAHEYYANKVTELWYTWRLIVEAGQFRGMTEEAMQEGTAREWGFVGRNKIQVEPKDKMKLKTGRSPDVADAMVVGCEMARRLGFVIADLAPEDYQPGNDKWKRELRQQSEQLWHAQALHY